MQNFLQRVPLFADLGPEEIGRLTEFCAASETVFAKGNYIIKQGDEGHEFFIVTAGTAVATIDVPGLKPATVKHYYKGDFFGELALMRADSRRAANIVATSETLTCIKLSRDDFKRLVEGAGGGVEAASAAASRQQAAASTTSEREKWTALKTKIAATSKFRDTFESMDADGDGAPSGLGRVVAS